jgi:hypothetical protein
MSVSIDVPGQGRYDIPVSGTTTAADAIARIHEYLPSDCPWHGNKLLSCGPSHLRHNHHVSSHAGAIGGAVLVLANYSELSLPETCASCYPHPKPCKP